MNKKFENIRRVCPGQMFVSQLGIINLWKLQWLIDNRAKLFANSLVPSINQLINIDFIAHRQNKVSR